jgi:hypothetical protein
MKACSWRRGPSFRSPRPTAAQKRRSDGPAARSKKARPRSGSAMPGWPSMPQRSAWASACVPHLLAEADLAAGRVRALDNGQEHRLAYWLVAPLPQWRQKKGQGIGRRVDGLICRYVIEKTCHQLDEFGIVYFLGWIVPASRNRIPCTSLGLCQETH